MSTPDPDKNAFYAASVNAWYGTRLEHDKSLLTLSAGGIGLLITLLSTAGIQSIEILLLYIVALMAFICCLASVLWIFKQNAIHLQNVNQGKIQTDPKLTFLDNLAIGSFAFGVLISSIIGISAGIHSYQRELNQMTTDNHKSRLQFKDSVNDVAKMAPNNIELFKKSYNDVASMMPAPQATVPVQTPLAVSPNASSTTKENSDSNLEQK